MDHKLCAVAVVIALLVGVGVGAVAFPRIVTVEKALPPVVTEKVVTIEVPKEVVKEVPIACPAPPTLNVTQSEEFKTLLAEYKALAKKYEAATDEYIDLDDLALEQDAIVRAEATLREEYKHLLLTGSYTPSHTTIVKYYDEDASVTTVRRYIDGRYRDFKLAEAYFSVKVRYEDNDGIEYKNFAVKVTFDVDSGGEEKVDVEVDPL